MSPVLAGVARRCQCCGDTAGEGVAPWGIGAGGPRTAGPALTHARLPVLRRPVPAAALAPVAARYVQADGEGAALAQAPRALIDV